MADRDIEQVADLYADPHPEEAAVDPHPGEAALRWLIEQLDEMDRAAGSVPETATTQCPDGRGGPED